MNATKLTSPKASFLMLCLLLNLQLDFQFWPRR